MDENLKKLIEENNTLIKESIEISKQNQKKIKKIHSYIRRTFVAKIMYWVIIILVAVGFFYRIQPGIKKAIERYQLFQLQLDTTTETLNNSNSLIDGVLPDKNDLGILNGLFNL